MININKFMSKKAANNLRRGNLHKVAAVMARNQGEDVGSEVDLPTAVNLIAKKAYIKGASYKNITNGILAMNDLLKRG